MRISKDKDSWKASGVIRRDFRRSHDGPEVIRSRNKRKNLKRWCRGKEGKEHDFVVVPKRYEYSWFTSTKYVCTVCGKLEWRKGK